jgi:hypothetical protein
MWLNGKVDRWQVVVNIGSPVFLLLFLTVGIRVGSRSNTKLIIGEVEKLVAGDHTKESHGEDKIEGGGELEREIIIPEQRSLARLMFFNFLFILAYFVCYGTIIYLLWRLHFSLLSGFLFVVFITIVTYLAIRIRYTSERYRILPRRRGVGWEVLYFFAMPVLRTGQWLAGKFSRYNIVLLIFDLLFEAPYKTLVFLFRDFSDFAREKREIE